jgi:pilus assembly protein CpaF
MTGFWPLSTPFAILQILEESSTQDIWINAFDQIFIHNGTHPPQALCSPSFTDAQHVTRWILDILAKIEKSWDASYPFVDVALPTQHRLHVIFPPICNEPTISIRSHRSDDLLGAPKSFYPQEHFETVQNAFLSKQSVLICGASGSGKTTLATTLMQNLPGLERIIAIEDTPELNPRHPHFIRLQSRLKNADGFGEITLTTLIRQALRMRPDRIILGECRGAEVLDFLQILNTGHPGSLCTLHANSAGDAIARLTLLALLARPGLPERFISGLILSGLKFIVFLEKKSMGFEISQLMQIAGIEGDRLLLRSMVKSPGL